MQMSRRSDEHIFEKGSPTDNPGAERAVLGFVGLREVRLEPVVLPLDLPPAVAHVVVELGAHHDYVGGSDVVAVELALAVATCCRHRHDPAIVREVAAKSFERYQLKNLY